MPLSPDPNQEQALVFGPFRLLRTRKQLLEGDRPVRLGSRALELLIALVERAGEVVSRAELEACVWPRMVVEETSLRAHISALRKALGDGQDGARYIANVPARGYCFVGTVTRPRQTAHGNTSARTGFAHHNLPASLTRMIGRADALQAIADLLSDQRLVTIAGGGGMGKTTVALAVADALLPCYPHGVCFVDLSPVTDPLLVAGSVASALEIPAGAQAPLPALAAFLRDRHMLIVLDNCEHLIDAAAVLAERLLTAAPGLSVLATSREPLGAQGEWVYRLAALQMPQGSGSITAEMALAFPAVQLFVQRAMAMSEGFALSDAQATAARDICRRLDGIPLAIELAAARVDTLGVQGLAARLDDPLRLLTRGRRTAMPRHRSLRALLDWSHDLLSLDERAVLHRLAVFKTPFTLEAAGAVASGAHIGSAQAIEILMALVTKSLVSAQAYDDTVRYRLLDTTRTYAAEKLHEEGQHADTATRHAAYMLALLGQAENAWDLMARNHWMACFAHTIDDVRAALDWSFSERGDLATGVALTAVAQLPIFELGLLDEFHESIDRALNNVHRLSPPQPLLELRLNAALCVHSGLSTPQSRPQAMVFARTLELAGQLAEPRYRIAALYSTWAGAFGTGNYVLALDCASQVGEAARRSNDLPGSLLADRLRAQSLHFHGEHGNARTLAKRVLCHPAIHMPPGYTTPVPHAVSMPIILSRILWLQGFSDQAFGLAQECVARAAEAHPIALAQALGLAACPIALWRGDDAAARLLVDRLMELARRHASGFWMSWARSFDTVLHVRAAGPGVVEDHALDLLVQTSNHKERDCIGTLAEPLVHTTTISRALSGSAGWCAPEILRVHGERVLRSGIPNVASAAQAMFQDALARACGQGALSWELRSATSLARSWRAQGHAQKAQHMLAGVYARFTEGFETADLMGAKRLLENLAADNRARLYG